MSRFATLVLPLSLLAACTSAQTANTPGAGAADTAAMPADTTDTTSASMGGMAMGDTMASADSMAPMGDAMAAAPTGRYTVTIAAPDVPTTMSDDQRTQMVGPWVIDFQPGNQIVVTANGTEVDRTSYQVEGDRIMLPADDTGDYACHTAATYTWSKSDDRITFTRVQDDCDGRVVVLTTRPLTVAQ